MLLNYGAEDDFWNPLDYLEIKSVNLKGMSVVSPALAGRFFTTTATWEAHFMCKCMYKVQLQGNTLPKELGHLRERYQGLKICVENNSP